jgi:MFS family permease
MKRRTTALLVAGNGASLFGDGMFVVAIGFAVLAVGGGSGALGLILLAGVGTIFAMILPAGAIVDRSSRRLVVVGADLLRGSLQLLSAWIVSMSDAHWWYLLPGAIVFGAATALHQPATMSLAAEVVPNEQLEQVNGSMQAMRGIGLVVGGSIAGVIVAHAGPVPVMVVDALSFFACAACIFLIGPTDHSHATAARDVPVTSKRDDVRAAIAVVRTHRWLVHGLLFVGGFVVVSYAPIQVIGPAAAKAASDQAGIAAAQLWALISAATAVGMIVGGVYAFVRPPGAMMLIVRVLLVLGGLGPLGLALGVDPIVTLPGFAGVGAAMGLFTAGWESAKQSRIEQGMLARVASLDMFAQLSGMIVGVVAAATVATFISVQAVLVGIGAGCMLLAACSFLSPALAAIFRDRAAELGALRSAQAQAQAQAASA